MFISDEKAREKHISKKKETIISQTEAGSAFENFSY
jgi:hypothetical protein